MLYLWTIILIPLLETTPMSMKAARARTESMAQRLAKKPISEGFELWDKGFYLGAMRLFIFKAESAPPYQLAPCLDAVANLLVEMDEIEDAAENFEFARGKYDIVQQPDLAMLMEVSGLECNSGSKLALAKLNEYIQAKDQKEIESADAKVKTAFARLFYTKAAMTVRAEGSFEEAKGAVENAIALGWERVHVGYFLLGKIKAALGDVEGATAAYKQALHHCPQYLAPHLELIRILRESDPVATLKLLDEAIAVHPRSAIIRDKAFLLSEQGSDQDAVKLLDDMIASPPVEESEGGLSCKEASVATFLKAKAAIYADMGKLAEAVEAAEMAVQQVPTDEEAKVMLKDIKGVVDDEKE